MGDAATSLIIIVVIIIIVIAVIDVFFLPIAVLTKAFASIFNAQS